jgi:hypothetical protein
MKNRFIHKEYGPCGYYHIVDGRLVPAIMPVHERTADKESGSGQRREKIAGGSVLRIEFGKDRSDLLRSKHDGDI